MHSQKFPVYYGRQRKEVEGLHKLLVNFLVVLVQALGSEVEKRSHLPALMVASQKMKAIWKSQLDFCLNKGSLKQK